MDPTLSELRGRLKKLSTEFRELHDDFGKAINLAEQDPEMALTRSRRVLEAVVRDVFERHVGEPAGTRPLENLIQRIVKDGYFPRRLEAYANTVRGLGNLGAHGLENVAQADVVHSLSLLMAILEWYFESERPASSAVEAGRPTEAPLQAQVQPAADGHGAATTRTSRNAVVAGAIAVSIVLVGVVALVATNGPSARRGDAQTAPKPQRPSQPSPPALLPFLSVGPRLVASLLETKDVQRELKLSDEQVARVEALADRLAAKSMEEFQKLQDLPEQERVERRHVMARRLNADLADSLQTILAPQQTRRLDQLCLQYGMAQALNDPVVQAILKLTDQQKAMIREIEQGAWGRAGEIVRSKPEERKGTSKDMVAHRKRTQQRALAVLTEAQKAKWHEIIGEPFDAELSPARWRR